MKRFLLGLFVAISLSVYGATVLWPNGTWLETFQNGFLFGNGSIFSALDGVPTFDNRRLDDRSNKIFFQEDYEGASVSFTCGTNLTAADETTDEIAGVTSKSFTQGATPPTVGVKCEGPTITLDAKQQDKNLVEVCFNSTWSGNDNEMQFNVYDNTAAADILNLPITASTTPKEHCGYFQTSGTASIDYDIEVLVQNANDELIIDDIEFKIDPLAVADLKATQYVNYSDTSGQGSTGTTTSYFTTLAESSGSGAFSVDNSSTNGFSATILKDGVFSLQYSGNGIQAAWVGITKNSSSTSTNIASLADSEVLAQQYINAANHGFAVSWTGDLVAGDVIRFQVSSSGDISTGDDSKMSIHALTDAQGVVVKNVESSDVANTNVFSAKITNNGTAAVSSENLNWISSVTRSALGTVDITLNSGVFSVAPSVKVSPSSGSDRIASVVSVSTSTIQVRTEEVSAGLNTDYDFDIIVSKQGTDFVKESEKVFTLPVDSLTGNRVVASGNGSNVLTVNDPVPFTEEIDTAGAWDGDQYTVQKNNSRILIQGSTYFNSAGNRYMALFKNNTLYKQFTFNLVAGNRVYPFSFVLSKGETSSGDVLEIRSDNVAGTLINNANYHYITISEEYGDRGVFLGTFGQPTCYVKDVKSSGTAGGDSVTSYSSRTFNTLSGSCGFVSLSGGTTGTDGTAQNIVLESGTYNFDCAIPFLQNGYAKTKLVQTTDTIDQFFGSVSFSDDTASEANSYSFLKGSVTINDTKAFQVQHKSTTATASFGLGGTSGALGDVEIYSQCEITKVR